MDEFTTAQHDQPDPDASQPAAEHDRDAQKTTEGSWSDETLRRREESFRRAIEDALANVSHEMRTPLSVILMWAKMLEDDQMPEPDRREAIAAITRSAEALRRLIDDLLDPTR